KSRVYAPLPLMEFDFFSAEEGGRLVGVGVEDEGVVVSTGSHTSLSQPGPKISLKMSIFVRLSSGFFRRLPKSHWLRLLGSSLKVFREPTKVVLNFYRKKNEFCK
ncbi:hypothetical protein SK128_023245, partial [Halocaridina rubra]